MTPNGREDNPSGRDARDLLKEARVKLESHAPTEAAFLSRAACEAAPNEDVASAAFFVLRQALDSLTCLADCVPVGQKLVEAYPSNVPLRDYLANALERLGKFEEALYYLTEASKINEQNISLKVKIGNILLRLGRVGEAEEVMCVVLRKATKPELAVSALSVLRHALSRDIKSAKTVELVISAADQFAASPHVVLHSSLYLSRVGERERAYRIVSDARAADADNDVLRQAEVELLLHDGDILAAASAALPLIKSAGPPLASRMFFAVRESALRIGEPHLALSLAEAILLRGREIPATVPGAASLLASTGRPDRAISALRDATQARPDDVALAQELARLLSLYTADVEAIDSACEQAIIAARDEASFARSCSLWREAVSRHSPKLGPMRGVAAIEVKLSNAANFTRAARRTAYVQTGLAFQNSGALLDAEERFRYIVSIFPEDHEVKYRLARVLVQNRKHEEALRLLEALAERYDQDAEFLQLYSSLSLRSGDVKRAAEMGNRALSTTQSTPLRSALSHQLSRIYEKFGDTESSFTHLRNFIFYNPHRVIYGEYFLKIFNYANKKYRDDKGCAFLFVIEKARELIIEAPTNPNGHFMLIEGLAALGEFGPAQQAADEARTALEQNFPLILLLAQHLHALGFLDKAIQCYDQHRNSVSGSDLLPSLLDAAEARREAGLTMKAEKLLCAARDIVARLDNDERMAAACYLEQRLPARSTQTKARRSIRRKARLTACCVILTNFTQKLLVNSHLAPPGTGLIERTHESFSRKLKIPPEMRTLIFYDRPKDPHPKDDEYAESLKRILDNKNAKLYEGRGFGLRRMLKFVLNTVDTDLMLFLEHDWELMSENYDWIDILSCFEQNDSVNYVRFSANGNFINNYDFYLSKPIHEVRTAIPLLRTPTISNNPHVVRLSAARSWSDIYASPTRFDSANGGAGGNEEMLLLHTINHSKRFGRFAHHAKLGTYLLGSLYQKPDILHLGV
jgi:tetratricopeptide (TPR) repeat protein